MLQKTKEASPVLSEYRISFKLDERVTISSRHFMAFNARDALTMFAHTMVKLLFNRKFYEKREFLITKEFVRVHDKSFNSPQFQIDAHSTSFKESAHSNSAPSSLESIESIVIDMNRRIELVRFEEFNKWANRWYTLKLPLEEVQRN